MIIALNTGESAADRNVLVTIETHPNTAEKTLYVQV